MTSRDGPNKKTQRVSLAKRAVTKLPSLKSHYVALLVRYELRTAILPPAALVVLGAQWPFLAIGDGAHPVGGYTQVDQVPLRGVGAAVTEGDVVFNRSPLVAMTLDGYLVALVALHPGGVVAQDRCAAE